MLARPGCAPAGVRRDHDWPPSSLSHTPPLTPPASKRFSLVTSMTNARVRPPTLNGPRGCQSTPPRSAGKAGRQFLRKPAFLEPDACRDLAGGWVGEHHALPIFCGFRGLPPTRASRWFGAFSGSKSSFSGKNAQRAAAADKARKFYSWKWFHFLRGKVKKRANPARQISLCPKRKFDGHRLPLVFKI